MMKWYVALLSRYSVCVLSRLFFFLVTIARLSVGVDPLNSAVAALLARNGALRADAID
jgi:hypothetical protein